MIKAGVMKRGLEEAEASKCYPYRIGAVVFRNSAILSSGHNARRGHSIHPKYQAWADSLHAEQAALLGLDWARLKGCSIFVVRLTQGGDFSLARPCKTCMGLLHHVGIKKVFYTNRQAEIAFERV